MRDMYWLTNARGQLVLLATRSIASSKWDVVEQIRLSGRTESLKANMRGRT